MGGWVGAFVLLRWEWSWYTTHAQTDNPQQTNPTNQPNQTHTTTHTHTHTHTPVALDDNPPPPLLCIHTTPNQVAVVVGRPLEVPKVENPTPEIVAEYLNRYCQEVEALFHR